MTPPLDQGDPALRRLVDQVMTARDTGSRLDIRGGGTKAFYGGGPADGGPRGEPLDVRPLTGISSHEPTELVVTARAGTPLVELEAALAEHGQCLPFEPPRFGGGINDAGGGTVGGMVAAGLAGPARVSAGALRDYVLGVTMLNGRGEVLTFGGQVMKNVAGYDVSRLLAGSLGVLGVICEVSLKVLPRPAEQATLEFELDEAGAAGWFDARRRLPLPVNASSWHRGRLRVRLRGAAAAVRSACEQLGGTAIAPDAAAAWWDDVRDHRHAFFAADPLWRLSLPPSAPPLSLPGEPFVEWGGGQRWLRTPAAATQVRDAAARAGGHATLFRGGTAADRAHGVFAPLPAPLMRIHRELKAAFDPAGVFNPGRLYPDL